MALEEKQESPPEPFEVSPNALYPMAWLRERLRGILDLQNLLDSYGLRGNRKHRDALWGWEILEASRSAAIFNSKGPAGSVQLLNLVQPVRSKRTSGTRRRIGARDLRDE